MNWKEVSLSNSSQINMECDMIEMLPFIVKCGSILIDTCSDIKVICK